MVIVNLDHIIPYYPSLALKPPSKPSQSRASCSEVSEHSNFPLSPPSKSHPLPPRPPLPLPRRFVSQSAPPPIPNSSSSALYRSSGPIDIRHTNETNDFDEELAKLDAVTFKGQPCLNPSMDKDKYQQDDGGGNVATGQPVGLSSVSFENITKGRIGDSPQVSPAQVHHTHKMEGPSPQDPISSELSSTCTAAVDAEPSNCVLDELPTVDPNDNNNSTESYNSLTDNVTTDTAESDIVPRLALKCPDSMSENTATPTADSIQAIGCSATVEEDSILALAERQLSLHNEHDTSPGNEDVAQTTVHPVNDAASMTRASYAREQPETCGVSMSGSQNHSKSPSRLYSVSVVVPERPSIATTEQTKTSLQTSSMAKRKRNSVSPSDIDSDDHGDNDYADGNEDGDDSDTLPHPQKRRRRGVTERQRTGQVRQKTQSTVQRETVLSDEPRHHCQPTELQDIETIPVRGYLTRQVLLSRVVYSFTFEEDRRTDLLLSNKSTRSPSQDKDEGRQSGFKACSPSKSSGCTTGRRAVVLSKEDKLLMKLKQKDHLPWSEIVKH
ncbi:hypothetical protein BBP40_003095 [Aspergillus hancockii]|nr:hypothetical protein BBP40_003095 [Aspergillus hancockii]